jgi:hypothetical protein
MKKYTRNDGNNEEGIGSILQSQLHLYAYCRLMGYDVCLSKLINISHYQYIGETSENYNKKINDFFSFFNCDNKEGEYTDPNWLINNWGETYNKEKKTFINELSQKINYSGPFYFNKKRQTVSIHIRSKNLGDVCDNLNREYFDVQKEKYFINLINYVKQKHGENLDIHVFSQGDEESFKLFSDQFNCTLHINDDILTTMYHLINSNILLTSNSSLSWCSHLFGKNNYVYSRNNFFHSWYPETILVDVDGNVINNL